MNPIFKCGSFCIYPIEKKTGGISKTEIVVMLGCESVVLTLKEVAQMGKDLVSYMTTLRKPNVFSN